MKLQSPRWPGWVLDAAVLLAAAALVATTVGVAFLSSGNSPTGGDAASHLLYAKLYADDFLFSGMILPWVHEVFGGLPFLSYYFPLPFIVIATLSKVIGFAPAFKWGSFLAAMLLPGAVFIASRRWFAFSWQASLLAAAGALGFLLHEQNSIWGGNLLSTLAGEFAYSYGVFFALLAMMAWARAISLRRGWLVAALLEAATGFSHGFPLLLLGFSTAFLLLDSLLAGDRRQILARLLQSISLLARGHLLAFTLLAGWLWPMFEMHSLTVPNDASFPLSSWHDLLPAALWPVAGGGVAGLLLLVFPRVRSGWDAGKRLVVCYFVSAAGLAAVAFLAGDQLGLADIRFFPFVWLLGAIACGWLLGQAIHALLTPATDAGAMVVSRSLLTASLCLGLLGWLAAHVEKAPDWGLWNHSGLEAKPQWNNLSQLFPSMRGSLWSPRLAFEHEPANNDLGSTRSLEALSAFLNHRPVLEGLYMESALLGPAIYQLQSEISAQPSSPLVRFPSGSLDPQFAAQHMIFLHADTLLLRSARAKEAVEKTGLFVKFAESRPFSLYRLKQFDSRLVEIVRQPVQVRPRNDWMQDAFAWFRTRSRFEAYLPVYSADPALAKSIGQPGGGGEVQEKSLGRRELVFTTDRPGVPHLVKIAYHPRWQLTSKGTLAVAGPGFMLVVPQEKEIRLVFGHTFIGKLGIAATVVAALLSVWLLWRGRRQAATSAAAMAGNARYWLPMAAGWAILALAAGYFGMYSPERVYKQGWDALNANRLEQAAERFELAYRLRRPPAKKEEALFWLAKTQERAGNRAEAKRLYREVFEKFHGYWVPESLSTYIELERHDGRGAETEALLRRLREEYPSNPWTLKLDQPS